MFEIHCRANLMFALEQKLESHSCTKNNVTYVCLGTFVKNVFPDKSAHPGLFSAFLRPCHQCQSQTLLPWT